jgi:DNA polymerase-3 subunit delta
MSKVKTGGRQAFIYVIAGKDDALVNGECDRLIGELLGPEERSTGLFQANPAEVEAAELFDELRTLPFLASKRVAVVRGADKFISANRGLLEKYFDNPSSTGVLILTVSGWDARTKLAKKLPGAGRLISVTAPKRWQLPERLVKYAKDAYGKNLTKEAAELLIELTGEELGRLYGDIDKLAVYADGDRSITAGHVERLIGHNRFYNAFAVIDAVTAGERGQAVDRLRSMFAEDKSTEYTVVGAFAYHFRRLFKAKALLEQGVRSGEITKRVGIWSNQEGFFRQLRRLSLRQVGDILRQLAEIDYAIKTGRTKAQVAIERLVLELSG